MEAFELIAIISLCISLFYLYWTVWKLNKDMISLVKCTDNIMRECYDNIRIVYVNQLSQMKRYCVENEDFEKAAECDALINDILDKLGDKVKYTEIQDERG